MQFYTSTFSADVGLLSSAKLKFLYQASLGRMDIPQSVLHVSMRIEKSGSDKFTENLCPGIPSPPITTGVTASITCSRVRCVHSLLFISSLKVISLPLLGRIARIFGKHRFKSDMLTALISSTEA